jgi:hypothetical protein
MIMTNLTEQAAEYRLPYSIVSRAHHLAAKRCVQLNNLLGVPVVAMTAALGTLPSSTHLRLAPLQDGRYLPD